MADHESVKIDPENHLLLDQSLLRLPHELLRKNFRSAHVIVERDKEAIKKLLKEGSISGLSGSATSKDDVLKSLDAVIARSKKLKTKLAACKAEESRLFQQNSARIDHLGELYDLHTFDDVKYETWSRARLDRLIVDYLLRKGYSESARSLATEKDMSDLVDIETFVSMLKIQNCLKKGSVTEALAWCSENKKELRKINSNLEFQLRFQQYIELIRLQTPTSLLAAISHAKKSLYPFRSTYPKEVIQAAGLLAFSPTRPGDDVYVKLYSPYRWTMLADMFTQTHNELLSLPSIPLLHVALSSGLSALKTPACHHQHQGFSDHHERHHQDQLKQDHQQEQNPDGDVDMMASTSSDESARAGSAGPSGAGAGTGSSGSLPPSASFSNGGNMCPICSPELNLLAKIVPYAHHSKSHVDHDLMLLPNSRVYGLERLMEHARKQGLEPGKVKDPRGGEVYDVSELKKVFIT